MPSSLFFKIYLAILGTIAILAVTGIASVALLMGSMGGRSLFSDRAQVIAAALPDNADPDVLEATLVRLGKASGAQLKVVDADGALIARYDPTTTPASGVEQLTIPLDDGRTLSVTLARTFAPPQGNPLFMVVIVSGLVALVAWPVVRHLTVRLERLRHSVEAWGGGDLTVRAPIMGNDEIGIVAKSFNNAAEKVETLIASNKALLANASHELRSPLARLRLGYELSEIDPSDARRDEIYRNLEELDELVGEILLSSRLDHVQVHQPMQSLDLLAVVAEECAMVGLEARGTSVEVSGDDRLLHRLVRNLLQNALRHGQPPISITVSRKSTDAELVVYDRGPGIDEADRTRVFEPFYRPDGHNEDSGGWGLGLALVRHIARRHLGSVRVEAPLEGGARFIVTLPRAAPDLPS